LGALMLDNRTLEQVSDFLRPYHFHIPVHQQLYEAILKLAELASSVISIINAEDYGRTIYDLYMRRELIALGHDLLRDAYEPRLE
jgi:replicative DNA helicase